MNNYYDKPCWKAYFKHNGGEAIVYGDNEREARYAALAYYRKNATMMDNSTIDQVVELVKPIA